MITTSIINLKGGTGKSISAANIAYILATYHKKRVLLLDADKQGSSSRYFNLYDDERKGIAEIFTNQNLDITRTIYSSGYERLDIITSNMYLYDANTEISRTASIESAFILKRALERVENNYDYCIIDNAPAIDKVVINALVASDNVLIPVRVDDFSFSGMADLMEQINNAKTVAPSLTVRGAFITHYSNDSVHQAGKEALETSGLCPVMKSVIRYNRIISKSTFMHQPIHVFNSRSWAAIEYKKLVHEYLKMTDSDKK